MKVCMICHNNKTFHHWSKSDVCCLCIKKFDVYLSHILDFDPRDDVDNDDDVVDNDMMMWIMMMMIMMR